MSESIVSAVVWIEHMITGSLATLVATIAVGTAGLAIMMGRLPVRRGAEIVLGIFVVFGAPAIARGISALPMPERAEMSLPASNPPIVVRAPPMAAYDPYAGASVPQTRASSDIFAAGKQIYR
ncbi:TrbC/VirB2 family protein [Sphingomonas sp. Leaf21]|uniref:TrbC/VirB2 family protein n=1 Tax=Sphingomonas sp. Leaf21 TaxID=2876550 RepID=UPI001E3F707D|nr:TrbC/VirB2 family protein [Sphingomonas sp. Leaf21]